jgi:Antirepressor regulating drug resistance, predicted signal transduction N-terminal membrane component
MKSIFSGILLISLQATFVAVLILLMKRLFINRLNIRTGYLLWLLVLVRLMFPALPASPVSVFNYIDLQKPARMVQSISGNSNAAIIGDMDNNTSAAENPGTVTKESSTAFSSGPIPAAKSSSPTGLFSVLSYIWAAGALMTIIYFISANLVFSYRTGKLKPVYIPGELDCRLTANVKIRRRVKYVESPDINSPCVFGIFRCTVILPEGMVDTLNVNELSHVLTHEYAHIKHWDLFFVWLSSLLCAIHWFNPVLWYCSMLFRREQELCADAFVISYSGENAIEEYGRTLIAMARDVRQRRYAPVTAGINEKKRSLKERIRNISLFSKKHYRITMFGLAFLAIAALFFCTTQMGYPKTGEERMKFDDNVMFEFVTSNTANPRGVDIKVHNNNKIGIHSCRLEIFDKSPQKAGQVKLLNASFSVGGCKATAYHIDNIDLDQAYLNFEYKVGYTLDMNSNRTSMSGDLKAFDKTAQVNSLALPSDAELEQFVKANNITPLAISKVYNSMDIVFFENGSMSGYHSVYKDTRFNMVRSQLVQGMISNDNLTPITSLGGTASGSFPYVCLKINDPALYVMGKKMELVTDYGTKEFYMWGAKAYAIETRGCGSVNKILVYGQNGRLIYDGEKSLVSNVSFRYDDPLYQKVTTQKGYKITAQKFTDWQIEFTPAMFPSQYIKASEFGNTDWKIPLFSHENSTLYLKGIFESNSDKDYLNALLYFINDIDNKPGTILSVDKINISYNEPPTYTGSIWIDRDAVFGQTIFNSSVSLTSTGPGDQFGIYIRKDLVEKTKGSFKISLENINRISYTSD